MDAGRRLTLAFLHMEEPAAEKTVNYRDGWEEPPTVLAARIAGLFDLPHPLEAYEFADKGNIHLNTFHIEAGGGGSREDYLLQQINTRVFTRPDWVMAAMLACIQAQREGLARGVVRDDNWEPIELVATRAGEPYLRHDSRRGRSIWRLMKKIGPCRSYKSLSEAADRRRQLQVAREAARGLAIYGDLTADMETSGLHNPLPGYRDTRLYYQQLRSVLAENRSREEASDLLPTDPQVLRSTAEHFLVHLSPEEYQRRREHPQAGELVDLVLANQEFATTLLRAMEGKSIRRVAIHGDTKLDNFLFSAETGAVRALVDLDTILPHTWLADWGDMARSLCNVAGEKERDPNKVQVDEEVFAALAEGFLGAARRVTDDEIELMVDAVAIITLELGMRFLTDYLRGDSYFKLAPTDPADLNRVRALVQLTLFQRLKEGAPTLQDYVERHRPEKGLESRTR